MINNLRVIKGLCIFYQKLIIPSLALSAVIALFMTKLVNFHTGTGIAFMLLTPVFHYFTYEVNNPGEYFFYYNLGLSKLLLWLNTFIVSVIIGLLLILI
ncbi:hypothetical protein [Pedobacter cryoconitis]|uniref:Uncharacterized protein n=1 Tax=Pedobacter cryoconitis TaxID=188932 RepID=A0A7X0J563_9SPHI|nr:hypothetical protein [Pedobacter cryoconitis]MBB6501075.1 hypothetical protein [Pedobacter cryoconitis]